MNHEQHSFDEYSATMTCPKFSMVLRSDVTNVQEEIIKKACDYFYKNPNEVVMMLANPEKEKVWDGYCWVDEKVFEGDHWKEMAKFAAEKRMRDLWQYIHDMGETHLREQIQSVMEKASPRLYYKLNPKCIGV